MCKLVLAVSFLAIARRMTLVLPVCVLRVQDITLLLLLYREQCSRTKTYDRLTQQTIRNPIINDKAWSSDNNPCLVCSAIVGGRIRQQHFLAYRLIVYRHLIIISIGFVSICGLKLTVSTYVNTFKLILQVRKDNC